MTSLGKISSDGLPHSSNEHLEAAKQIVRYLKQTHDVSVFLGGKSLHLFGFSDAKIGYFLLDIIAEQFIMKAPMI